MRARLTQISTSRKMPAAAGEKKRWANKSLPTQLLNMQQIGDAYIQLQISFWHFCSGETQLSHGFADCLGQPDKLQYFSHTEP